LIIVHEEIDTALSLLLKKRESYKKSYMKFLRRLNRQGWNRKQGRKNYYVASTLKKLFMG
jgi:hypothetical protein